MRERLLPPPRQVFPSAETIVDPANPGMAGVLGGAAPPGSANPAPELRELAQPVPVRPRLRKLFDPVKGWYRRLERACNRFCAERVYNRIPWSHVPYGLQLDYGLTVSHARVRLPNLPPAFDGLRALLITDTHTGPFVSPACLERAFRRLRSLEPDLILIGGDLTTSCVREFLPSMGAFSALSAPLGVYGVLGNHDHYTEDVERLRDLIERSGVRLLHNTAVAIERRGSRLILGGIDDLISGEPDLDAMLARARGLAGSSSADGIAPSILLSHNPDVFFDAARCGVPLVLSGHTHGGQVRIPGLPVLARMSRYHLDEGRYSVDGSELIVSRGLGSVGLPLRLACPPEAVLLELRPADPAPGAGNRAGADSSERMR